MCHNQTPGFGLNPDDQLATTGFSGISRVKLVPIGDNGRVSSAPNCIDSALTRRVPRRLLVVGSNCLGRPTPSSCTDTKIVFFSVRTSRTEIKPPGQSG